MKPVMRLEAPSNQLPVPSELVLLSIPSFVGLRRVIPTLSCGYSGGGDRPRRGWSRQAWG